MYIDESPRFANRLAKGQLADFLKSFYLLVHYGGDGVSTGSTGKDFNFTFALNV
jgi:hypothetical protein